ncbi:ABC transporter permease [Halococcus qingdaonensis]|uniref:ABC transporter permease n=1 Tax=Halococcus qingdaonensis TaxID=224402 RepID=UPI0021161CAF|nr:ABC transporter permease [Halococcus qingdaonensis]
MSYTRTLLSRWSRRDRLTVVVVAVTTAFLVGTTLLLAAAGAQTATIADELDTTATVSYEGSYGAAQANATTDEIVLPTATLRHNDSLQRFVGVPPNTTNELGDTTVGWQRATLPAPNDTVQGPVATRTAQRFATSTGPARLTVRPHATNASLFPTEWYVANASTVRTVSDGDTEALVIHPTRSASGLLSVPETGSPIVAALVFLFAGMRELLAVLLAATLGSAVLVVVVVYNVLRMTVRDRRRAIRVIRSTGGTPRRILALFGVRAGLIVTIGVALGYAVGMITTNAVVNVAVFAGLPISLTPTLTPVAIAALAVILPGLVLAGVLAGVLAAWSAATAPPARIGATTGRTQSDRSTGGRRAALRPTLLAGRAIVPTALTLAVFVVVVVLVVSLMGAVAPLSTQSEGTIAEADAPHVLNSRIDTNYVPVLRERGVAASPEIILPQALDGEPFLGLGANYTAFAAVTNASLVEGRPPRTSAEAVVGSDLATTLDIDVGESLPLGGSFSPATTRVTVVGTFDATGVADDQLVVPLSTAHHLALDSGTVQYIRTERTALPDGAGANDTGSAGDAISVTGVSIPRVVEANRSFAVTANVENLEATNVTRPITVRVGNRTRTRSVTLGPEATDEISIPVRLPTAGNRTLRVDSYTQSVRVLPRRSLWLPTELPGRAPPNATLYVPVVTPAEQPVENASVAVANRTWTTGDNGVARVTLPTAPGEYTLRASKGERPAATQNLTVTTSAQRRPSARLAITPQTGSVLERPEATVTVANPWNRTLTRRLTLTSPVTTRERNVTLEPGATTQVTVELFGGSEQRASPGTYTVRLQSNESSGSLARSEYTVEGDQRLFSALASNGQYSGGAGIGQAIRSVFGNVQLLFVTMLVLAALTTIGTTTATFTQVIHARRRAIGIHRATGASPRRVLTTVLRDVCLLSVPAVAVALALGVGTVRLLGQLDLLTLFGIRLSTAIPGPVLLGTAVGAFALSVLGAVLATLPFLTRPPTDLLDGTVSEPTTREDDR